SSPSASWANQVIPSTASSPSTRAQSWSLWYFRSSGYDSAAAKSALPLVDRFLDDLPFTRLAAHVDRLLGPGRRPGGGHVAHPDADVEHRRVRAGGHLAAALDGHAVPRDCLLLHHERDELPLRAVLLDPPQRGDSGELLAERACPAEAGRDRVG